VVLGMLFTMHSQLSRIWRLQHRQRWDRVSSTFLKALS
jgi:hypothetical protein